MAIESVNPATGEVLEIFREIGREDVERMLAAAHAAFLEWRDARYAARAKNMRQAATILRLMGCCGAGGTSIENFILGKRTYVESKDPGATKYGAEISGTWNGAGKPDF